METTDSKPKLTYELIKEFKSGHKYFRSSDVNDDSIYVADGSGATPDKTTDGVMWIDRSRHMEVGVRAASLPVQMSDGRRYGTPIDVIELFWLSDFLRLPVYVAGLGPYHVSKNR